MRIDSASLTRGSVTLRFVPAGEYATLKYMHKDEGTNILNKGFTVNSAGTSIVGGSTVFGSFLATNKKPAGGAHITLVPHGYLPWETNPNFRLFSGTANSNGDFFIIGVDTGAYSLEARDDVTKTRLLLTNIRVSGDSVQIPQATMKATEKVVVYLPENIEEPGGYIYIPNTTLYAPIDTATFANGFTVLDEVPEGNFSGVKFVKSVDLVEDADFEVRKAESAIVVAYGDWKHSAEVIINTGINGAAIKNDQREFPLLVRLDKDNFNFNEAAQDGKDLRFSTHKHIPLSYEIETWDSENRRAHIWVRTNKIKGNRKYQYIRMYWGNDQAQNSSLSQGVFDTSMSYAGVWHLGENGNNDERGYRDATPLANHGTGVNMTTESDVTGVTGKAQQFDSTKTYISLGNLAIHNQPVHTISFWVKSSPDQADGRIFAEAGANLQSTLFALGQDQFGHNNKLDIYIRDDDYEVKLGHHQSRRDVFDNSWHHIAWVDSLGDYKLYIDGSLDAMGYYEKNQTKLLSSSIGAVVRNDVSRHLACRVDEFRLSVTARSEDWIKLSYENQKPDSKIVRLVRLY